MSTPLDSQQHNIKILMSRICSRIRAEIYQGQCGFAQDTGTRNVIFIIRMLSEHTTQIQKELY